MFKTHQIKLYPNRTQEVLLRRSCGVARFAYNWALSEWKKRYESGEKTSAYSLIKHLTAIKREQFPWMLEVSKSCPQYAIHNLEVSFRNFFRKSAGYPRFKKKGVKDSFVAVENKNVFNQKNYKIHIPRIGKIKCSENLRYDGRIINVTVKRVADMWFACIRVDIPETPIKSDNQTTVGVDMGIKSMMVLSDGTVFENPKALKSNLKSLKRLQRSLTRKAKGSANRKKAAKKLARKYYRVSCLRSNAIHQATAKITNSYGKVVIEDLHSVGMIKNKNLSQSVSDVSFGQIKRQLLYKAKQKGIQVVIANRFYPSSKLCSECGHKKDILKLSQRTYSCEKCGLGIDRDLNAARNLAKYSPTSKSEGS